MNQHSARNIIEQLKLAPHPEGGFYRETYRSRGSINNSSLPQDMIGSRSYSTAIYFLLPKDQCSKFHRLKSDELWHFHLGSPVEIIMINQDKTCHHVIVGPELNNGQQLQFSIPAGTWFAARCLFSPALGDFSFVSCTVSPGFEFLDFEMADDSLLDKLPDDPQYAELIRNTVANASLNSSDSIC